MGGATDNQGNSFLIARCLSTAFPLNVILMQAAEDLEQRGAWLDLQWVRRNHNEEADELTNEAFGRFDARRRVPFVYREEDFTVMHRMSQAAADLFMDVQARRRHPPLFPYSFMIIYD